MKEVARSEEGHMREGKCEQEVVVVVIKEFAARSVFTIHHQSAS